MDILRSKVTSLKAVGKDEKWLQDWICEDPSRLGLGNVAIKAKELRHYTGKGGALISLAYNGALDTYYEIEIMLGDCDADHGFRVLDYWARERIKYPNAKHFGVLIAEDLSGRYKTAIETLPQFIPFIGIEMKTLLIDGTPQIATTFPVIVAQPDDLVIKLGDDPQTEEKGLSLNDEATWAAIRPDFVANAKEMFRVCIEKIGPSKIDFSAKSYISLKRGLRCWLPMWPRKDGFYVYISGGSGGAEDQPTDFYARVKESLAELGIEPSWTYKYNAGANPIGFPIAQQNITHSKILDILTEAYSFA